MRQEKRNRRSSSRRSRARSTGPLYLNTPHLQCFALNRGPGEPHRGRVRAALSAAGPKMIAGMGCRRLKSARRPGRLSSAATFFDALNAHGTHGILGHIYQKPMKLFAVKGKQRGSPLVM